MSLRLFQKLRCFDTKTLLLVEETAQGVLHGVADALADVTENAGHVDAGALDGGLDLLDELGHVDALEALAGDGLDGALGVGEDLLQLLGGVLHDGGNLLDNLIVIHGFLSGRLVTIGRPHYTGAASKPTGEKRRRQPAFEWQAGLIGRR